MDDYNIYPRKNFEARPWVGSYQSIPDLSHLFETPKYYT